MTERIFNFEYLTQEENEAVTSHYRRCRKAMDRNLITASEAQFIFTEKMIADYSEKAFGICTNVPMFNELDLKVIRLLFALFQEKDCYSLINFSNMEEFYNELSDTLESSELLEAINVRSAKQLQNTLLEYSDRLESEEL